MTSGPSSPSCRNNSPRPARIPRIPPSPRPRTSSSPPSPSRHPADSATPPNPRPPPGHQRRKPGAKPGPPPPQPQPSPPEMLASIPTDSLLDACPSCGGHLLLADRHEPDVVQQVDIVAVP